MTITTAIDTGHVEDDAATTTFAVEIVFCVPPEHVDEIARWIDDFYDGLSMLPLSASGDGLRGSPAPWR